MKRTPSSAENAEEGVPVLFRSPAGQGRRSLAQLLFVVLQHIELIVPAVVGQKLLMGALLQNLAVGEDDDVVRMLDGGQAVRHDEHGADGAHFLLLFGDCIMDYRIFYEEF